MKIFLIILISVLAALACVAFFVKVRLGAFVSTGDTRIFLKIGFVKITLYPQNPKASVKNKPSDDKVAGGIGSVRDFWENNSDSLKKALLRLKNRIVIEKFNFEYNCGFADAAVTAVMYGVVHGLYSNVFAFLDYNFRLKEMRGSISADFNEHKKHIALDSVLYLTVSDIIYIAAALLPVIKNLKK